MNIRRTTYTVRGEHVSLPFIATLADEHPEFIAASPAPSPTLVKVRERRGPRRWERAPRMTDAAKARDRIGYEQIMRRIARGGV